MNASEIFDKIFRFISQPGFIWTVGILVILIGIVLYFKWLEGPLYKKTNRIDGKVAIVTGCNTGIGKETALALAKRGARVYMACRDFKRCEMARREIINLSGNKYVYNCILDLGSLQSVRAFVEAFNSVESSLDILINNAGIMGTPHTVTVDGYEQQLAVNHLGHFLLTNLLLDKLKASAPSRIVVVSSVIYRFGRIQKDDLNSEKNYNANKAYYQSKLANILFSRKLAQILYGSGVTVNCLHPGIVQTELGRNIGCLKRLVFSKLFARSAKGGAQTSIFLALDPELADKTGGYYSRMALTSLTAKARDDEMANWLWTESEKMVGLNQVTYI